MPVHIIDSEIFKIGWSTPELRELFEESSVVKGWIEVMAVLAETEAEFGLIPAHAAGQLAETSRSIVLDEDFFSEVRRGFEQSNHSLLGLIRALQRRSPGNSGEWWCYGATVQDITDTQTARQLLAVRENFKCRLDNLTKLLCALAMRFRDTPMCGRTHGQPGLPITFGFKAAGWLDEIHRHRVRLAEIGPRLAVGQIAGGVGTLSSF
ncbi:MAG: lyase family protein, partial [Gammaproteobacteria bacterium]